MEGIWGCIVCLTTSSSEDLFENNSCVPIRDATIQFFLEPIPYWKFWVSARDGTKKYLTIVIFFIYDFKIDFFLYQNQY